MSSAIGIFLSTEKRRGRVFLSYSNTFNRAPFTYLYTTIHTTQTIIIIIIITTAKEFLSKAVDALSITESQAVLPFYRTFFSP